MKMVDAPANELMRVGCRIPVRIERGPENQCAAEAKESFGYGRGKALPACELYRGYCGLCAVICGNLFDQQSDRKNVDCKLVRFVARGHWRKAILQYPHPQSVMQFTQPVRVSAKRLRQL